MLLDENVFAASIRGRHTATLSSQALLYDDYTLTDDGLDKMDMKYVFSFFCPKQTSFYSLFSFHSTNKKKITGFFILFQIFEYLFDLFQIYILICRF
jgi:hypothetical protein